MSLENDVIYLLKKHPGGLRRSEIAMLLDIDKREVSTFMHSNKDKFYQDDDWYWRLRRPEQYNVILPTKETTIKKPKAEIAPFKDPIFSKLNNQSGAKTFSLSYFNSMADWSNGKSHGERKPVVKHKTSDGRIIECDSKYEEKFLDYLKRSKRVITYGGQSLCIKYDSCFREDLSYYPDIAFLTTDNHIAFVEIKPVENMSHHTNIEKYEALQAYCEFHGYTYMMIDPQKDFMTFDELEVMDVCDELEGWFDFLYDEYGNLENHKKEFNFNNNDVELWYSDIGDGYTKEEFRLMVHSLIIREGWFNKKKFGFDVYNYPHK